MSNIIKYDRYEIHGCAEVEIGCSEQVPDADAEYWTLFGHIPGKGLDDIGDFGTLQEAEAVYERITGLKYGKEQPQSQTVECRQCGQQYLVPDETRCPGCGNTTENAAEIKPTKFKVETLDAFNNWVDAEWKNEDGTPMLFDTEEEAQSEIDDHCDMCQSAYRRGDLKDCDKPEHFQVVET